MPGLDSRYSCSNGQWWAALLSKQQESYLNGGPQQRTECPTKTWADPHHSQAGRQLVDGCGPGVQHVVREAQRLQLRQPRQRAATGREQQAEGRVNGKATARGAPTGGTSEGAVHTPQSSSCQSPERVL